MGDQVGYGVEPSKCQVVNVMGSKKTTYYMDRFWSLFHMPGISDGLAGGQIDKQACRQAGRLED